MFTGIPPQMLSKKTALYASGGKRPNLWHAEVTGQTGGHKNGPENYPLPSGNLT